ncbi:MAG: 4Fe-4S dicluster domain-containing protein [Candidatus Poribacteria bacterium]
MSNYKTFRGGYRFAEFQGQPDDVLEETSIPTQVKIPLVQGFGSEVDCLVKVGDKVSAGQIIARNDQHVSSPIHATVNGEVNEIKKSHYLGQNCFIVTIKSDGSSEYQKISGASANWQQLSPESIEEILYTSGITALGYEGIPSRFNSSIIQPNDVENIIVYMLNSDPYNISPTALFHNRKIQDLLDGIDILHRIMPKAKVFVATSSEYKNVIGELDKNVAKYNWLKLLYLKSKYPQSHEAMLVKTVLGQDFPYGYSAANIGTIILDFQAVLQAYEAVAEGKPLIERTIALCGSALKAPLHVKVRTGTSLSEIAGSRIKPDVTPRFILNNLLMGTELADLALPIDRTYSQIIAIPENRNRKFLAFIRPGFRSDSYTRTFMSKYLPIATKTVDTNKNGEERPCISCNYCEEVCPVSIIPHILSKYVQRDMIDETLANLHIFDCIQCGLCSYVCPSKISLAQHIKAGMDSLTEQGCNREVCILPHFDNIRGIVESYRGAKEI